MLNFKELIIRAKRGENSAIEELLEMYRPLLTKESIVEGVFDEDLYQELCYRFVQCMLKALSLKVLLYSVIAASNAIRK